jgi:hypothetical protein
MGRLGQQAALKSQEIKKTLCTKPRSQKRDTEGRSDDFSSQVFFRADLIHRLMDSFGKFVEGASANAKEWR